MLTASFIQSLRCCWSPVDGAVAHLDGVSVVVDAVDSQAVVGGGGAGGGEGGETERLDGAPPEGGLADQGVADEALGHHEALARLQLDVHRRVDRLAAERHEVLRRTGGSTGQRRATTSQRRRASDAFHIIVV